MNQSEVYKITFISRLKGSHDQILKVFLGDLIQQLTILHENGYQILRVSYVGLKEDETGEVLPREVR